jgi:hypothetical protein
MRQSALNATPLMAVAALLDGLVARERRLVAARALLAAVGWLGGGVLAAQAALALRADLGPTAALATVVVGVGLWLGVVRPLLRGLAAAGDAARQARALEALEPRLEGRLASAATHVRRGAGAASPLLLGWVAEEALRRSRGWTPVRVHPARPWLARALLGSGATWAAVLCAVVAGLGPSRAAAVWWPGVAEPSGAFLGGQDVAASVEARVGDLTLRYVYPPYTRLEPYEVVNSTGEVAAVPGTRVEVSLRAARAPNAAALVAYDAEPVEAFVEGTGAAARVRGSFVVGATEGQWRVLLAHGEVVEPSPAFPIRPVPDAPPAPAFEEVGGELEVPADALMNLALRAEDDFGVARVELVVDGDVAEKLAEPLEPRPLWRDALVASPAMLGLRPGRTYELILQAWDNDAVSGSKVGRSAPLRLTVIDPDAPGQLSLEQVDELMAILVDALADHLEEPWPPSRTQGGFASWGLVLAERYAPLSRFLEARRSARGELVSVLAPSAQALDVGRRLLRLTQTSFRLGDREAAAERLTAPVTALRSEAVEELEYALILLDRARQKQLRTELMELLSTLDAEAGRLAAAAADDTLAGGQLIDRQEPATRLQAQLREVVDQLAADTIAELVSGRLPEVEALSETSVEAATGDEVARARTLMRRWSDRLAELKAAVDEARERQQRQAQERESELQKLLEALDALAQEQGALADRTASEGAAGGEASAAAWEAADQAVAAAGAAAAASLDALEAAGRSELETELARDAVAALESARGAIRQRDLRGAARNVSMGADAWSLGVLRGQLLAGGRPQPGPGPGEQRAVTSAIEDAEEALRALARRDAAASAASAAPLGRMAPEQAALGETLEGLAGDASRLGRELPVQPRGLERLLGEAGTRMDDAEQSLRAAEGLQAEGSQRAARDRIEEAIATLQEAMQASSEGEGEGGSESGEPGSGEGDEGDGSDEGRKTTLELPEPEDFRTPEDYRRALIEGMAADVPEAYRLLKARYFEELVHQ